MTKFTKQSIKKWNKNSVELIFQLKKSYSGINTNEMGVQFYARLNLEQHRKQSCMKKTVQF